MKFNSDKQMKRHRLNRRIFLIIVVLLIVGLVASAAIVRRTYENNLRPVSATTTGQTFTVAPGSSVAVIANELKVQGLVRSDWAFEWYVRNSGLNNQLKAGTYLLNPSMSVQDIAKALTDGKEATDLVTILPAKRLDQVREGLIKAGFTAEEVDAALEPSQYQDHPALSDKPKEASLEGYLYPESFHKTSITKVTDVIRDSLDQLQLRLTPDIRQAISQKGLTVHQGLTLASIIEQEVSDKNASDKPQVAQVLLKRYQIGMPLGADPTAFYAAIINGANPDEVGVGFDSPYNTRRYAGLPPGPIGNVSESSLKAVAYPAETDWLYFVAGDDGKTHFSKTLQEHEALTRQYCTKLCGN